MSNKTENYYSKERDSLYKALITMISQERIYTNLDFKDFVEKYFSHHTKDEFGKQIPLAQFHKDLVRKISNNTTYEAVVQIARNHAKTTIFSLFLPIYLMLKGETHFVLLVAASKDLAVKQIINIQAELETNIKLINDFGEFVKLGNWSKGNFIVERYETAFYCVGKGQSTRGLKYKHYRPDLVILDDIDTDKDVLNKNTINKQTNWVLQSVFPAMSIKKYRFVVLGNRFSIDMVLTRLMEEIDGVEVLKVNAFDNNGEVSWKERFSPNDLLNIKSKIGSIRFEREYMNNPIIEGSVFKTEWLEFYRKGGHNFDYVVSYVDPSFKKDADFKAIVTVGYSNGKYYVIDMFERKTTMTVVFNYLYDMDYKNHRIYIEANFAQDLHKDTYNDVYKKRGIPLPIVWDKSKKDNKIARIENMAIFFEQGLISFAENIKDKPDFKQFYYEYVTFPSAKNDDGIDALESAINTINKLIRRSGEILTGVRQLNIF